ncbi:hypothetical protein FRC12_021493 [Ceratobasidium sp. 428]|nr:hypothetical protein FRC12_021493 [Ceratobasidium sp. 428]
MSVPFPQENSLVSSSESVEISKNMSVPEITSILLHHGVRDVTHRLDLGRAPNYPVSGGLFSDTYRGVLSDGTPVAIKSLRHFIVSGNKQLKNLARELHTWSKLQHPNVLELLGFALFRDRLSTVSPWMQNGTLPQYINFRPQVDRAGLCVQVAKGLAYLHESGVVHGDLQGSNIFVSGEGVPKLANLRRAILNDPSLRFTGSNASGGSSLRWAAPELVNGVSVSMASDIYALGMTFIEIITGELPYAGESDYTVITRLMEKQHPERPEELGRLGEKEADRLWSTMLNCWSFEPDMRPDAAGVVDVDGWLLKDLCMLRGAESSIKGPRSNDVGVYALIVMFLWESIIAFAAPKTMYD